MQYRDLLKTLFWVCLLGIAILSVPIIRRKIEVKEEGKWLFRSHMIARLVALSALVGIFLFGSFKCQPVVCGGTIGDKDSAVGAVEIKESEGIISNVTFSDSRELESVEIPLKTENYNRADRSMLVFALCDDAGEMLWGTKAGMSQIKNGKLKLKIKGVRVESGRDYSFRIIKDHCPHGAIMKSSVYYDKQNNVFFWFR